MTIYVGDDVRRETRLYDWLAHKHSRVIRASEPPAQALHRHLVVGVVGSEVLQRGGGVLLLILRAVPRERHERLDAARARNRRLRWLVRARALAVRGVRAPQRDEIGRKRVRCRWHRVQANASV